MLHHLFCGSLIPGTGTVLWEVERCMFLIRAIGNKQGSEWSAED